MKRLLFILIALTSTVSVAQTNFDDPPVPIEFMDITSSRNEATVTLTWRTASELNNDFFTIEISVDGERWESIGTVPGSGTSKIINTYSFSVHNNNFAYYRIFQTDYDGTSKFVAIIAVKGIEFYPEKYYDYTGRIVDVKAGLVIMYSGNKFLKKIFYK